MGWTIASLSVRETAVVGTLILDFALQWVMAHLSTGCLSYPSASPLYANALSVRSTVHVIGKPGTGPAADLCEQAGCLAAYILQSDKFFDLFGSLNFIGAALGTLFYAHYRHARQIVVTVFVCCWAVRLGSLLFYRALKSGGDSRLKPFLQKPRENMLAYYWGADA